MEEGAMRWKQTESRTPNRGSHGADTIQISIERSQRKHSFQYIESYFLRSVDVADPSYQSIHLLNFPLAVDEHDIVAMYRCSLAIRSELPLHHHQIAVDPYVPERAKSPSRVALEQLRDHFVDSDVAINNLVGIVESDVCGVSLLHLGEAFARITFAEDTQ
jgi:hypothetical protein